MARSSKSEITKRGVFDLKANLMLAMFAIFSLLSYTAESIDDSGGFRGSRRHGDGNGIRNSNGENNEEKINSPTKRGFAGIENDESVATPSEHERKLLAGARIVASFASIHGIQMVRGCASEILREYILDEYIKDEDEEEPFDGLRNGKGAATISNRTEDELTGGQIIFLADEECMLYLKQQTKQDINWVDYDHPTKIFDIGDGPLKNSRNNRSSLPRSRGERKPGDDHSTSKSSSTNNQRDLQEFSEWAMSLIQADDDDIEKGNRNTKVCIVDTGINPDHPIFDGISISGASSRWQWDRDENGHGTRVAGVIAGFQNLLSGQGEIELFITRSSGDDGSGFEIDLYIAIEQCIYARVDVINVSNGSLAQSTFNAALYDRVVNHYGILLIAAAGNDGDYTQHFPAAHPAAIAVSSVDEDGDVWDSSNSGYWIELAAPGTRIVGPKLFSSSSSSDSSSSSSSDSEDLYDSVSGTSFASPFVAGAAALLRTHYAPDSCPSEALRYAMAINANVPGAPITGINGNNMNPLNPFLNRDMSKDDIRRFDSDRYVRGKCNDQYGNGMIKIRDALEWLEFYDCFSSVFFALEYADQEMTAAKNEAPTDCVLYTVDLNDGGADVPCYDPNNNEEGNDDRLQKDDTDDDGSTPRCPRWLRHGQDFRCRDDRLGFFSGSWAPRVPIEEDESDSALTPSFAPIVSAYPTSRSPESFLIPCGCERVRTAAIYLQRLKNMIPWVNPRVGGCYSG